MMPSNQSDVFEYRSMAESMEDNDLVEAFIANGLQFDLDNDTRETVIDKLVESYRRLPAQMEQAGAQYARLKRSMLEQMTKNRKA